MINSLAQIILLFCSLILFTGCGESGTPAYSVGGDESHGFSGVPGEFTIILGDPNPIPPNFPPNSPLLYYLVVAPGVSTKGSKFTGDHKECTSTVRWTWISDLRDVEIEARWDRCTGKVTIGQQIFDYKQGNAFVVIRAESGDLNVLQRGSFDIKTTKAEVLEQIKKSLPENSPGKNVQVIHWSDQPLK